MKAYHLTESAMPQTVAIIFGRFNPPHKGHKHAWETAAQVADDWYVGTNKSTIGPDDPLPFDVKIEAMKTIMPEVAEHLVAEQSWWTLATYVFKKYGGVPGRTLPITLLVITDEPYVVPGLLKSNGQVSNHGEYSFQDIKLPFENIEQAKKQLRISSATALRNAVAAGDREGFANAAGVDADTPVAGHKFFDLVAHYLLPHREAHAAKEKAKAEKAAAKQMADQAKAQKAAEKAAKAKGPAQELAESGICWKGYKRKPGTKKYAPGSCEKVEEIAGAFPSPSTRAQWAKDAAASNAAEARRQAELQRQANAARAAKLAADTTMVDRLNKVNYHGANAPKPTNATWDGDSDFLELDGTKYAKASRMPIPGGEAPDMKLISTQEGWQVYIWTRNSLKGVVGRYFFPAANPNTIQEGDVVKFPKKHKGDLEKVHSCPKCGGDLQGGKYMGHEVKVCMPCKQVYLPPNSGIDQKGDKIKEGRLSQALEQVYESRHGSIQDDVADSLPQTFVIPKLQNQDAYSQYRFGLAVAAARGQKDRKKEHGQQFAGMSPWGENEIVVTFDPSEAETIDTALKLVGLSSNDKRALNTKDSIETPDVVKLSPVAKIKRNKYGV